MRYIFILFAMFSLFLCNTSYGGNEFFTWKDAQGQIHITDQRPPAGMEILEITPRTSEAAKKLHREQQARKEKLRQENELESIRQRAAQARESEENALRAAEDLKKQARETRLAKEGTKSKKRYRTKVARNERKAANLDEKASEMLQRAETARKLAERLENRLGY